MRQVQCGKFPAAFEPMFIYGALVIAEKMTRHAVYDHAAIAAFLYIVLIKCFARLAQVCRKLIGFLLIYQHHQAFAAVTAVGTMDMGGNGIIELVNEGVYLFIVPFFHKIPEPVVFSLVFKGKVRNGSEIGFQVW